MKSLVGVRNALKFGVSCAPPRRMQPTSRIRLNTEIDSHTRLHKKYGHIRFSSSSIETAKSLNQAAVDEELHEYDTRIAEEQEKQRKAPWHREGSEDPPVRRQRSAGAMTKGKLLST